MALIPNVSPPERFNALARVSENNLTIAWVEQSLAQRCASYRFALNRLAVSEPEDLATNVDISSRCCSSKSPPTNWSRPQRSACRRSPWPARRRPSCRPQWRPSRRRS
jgi:hypothetical protein